MNIYRYKYIQRLGTRSQIVRISEPIKSEWSRKMNLNLQELLSDGPYKEKYRKDMIMWSDEVRKKDYGYFCKVAMNDAQADIIIVSDIRRKTDIRYFHELYGNKIVSIRLNCPEFIRAQRGWIFTTGIDDVESECGLDDYEAWTMIVENNNVSDGKQIVDLIMNKFELLNY